MKTIIDLPSRAELINALRYENGKLYWRAKAGDDRETRRWNSRYAGSEVGHPSGKGYLQFKLNGKNYMVHRAIWVILNGDVLNQETLIDHELVDPTANSHEFLRPATQSQNCAYAKRRVDSTYGKGITFRRGRYEARIQVDGKRLSLGSFKTHIEASAAYADAARRYFGEFARAA